MSRTPLQAGNVIYSLKTFAAAMLALGIALYFDLPRPYWALSTVYIVSNPLSGASASKASYRLLGTVIGGIVTVFLVPPLVSSPEILSLAIILWVSLCAYLAQLDPTPRNYIYQLAGYTVLVAALPVVDSPSTTFTYVVSRVEEIGIAIICASVVNHVVLPKHVGPVLTRQINGWLSNVTKLTGHMLRGQTRAQQTAAEWQKLAANMVSVRTLESQMAYDASHHRELSGIMRGLRNRMVLLLPVLSAIEDHVAALKKYPVPGNAAMEELLEETDAWIHSGGLSSHEASRLRTRARELENWSLDQGDTSLLLASLARRIRRLVELWHQFAVLHADLTRKKVSPESRQLLKISDHLHTFRDYNLALLAGYATAISIALPMYFWIASGWHLGMFVTQISGVFCCRWIGMDNPVFILKKILLALVVTTAGAVFYNFALLPGITDFTGLVAALGLTMIPIMCFRSTVNQRIISSLYCIFLPIIMDLQSTLDQDFETVINAAIALSGAILCCIVVINLVKTAGAEARARNLLRSGWRLVSRIAAEPRRNQGRRLYRLLDMVSFWASRQVSLSNKSDIKSEDLLRDLRLGHNLARLQSMSRAATREIRWNIDRLCKDVAEFYSGKKQGRDRETLVHSLERCREAIARKDGSRVYRRLETSLLALRLCLAPDAPAPAVNSIPLTPVEASNARN